MSSRLPDLAHSQAVLVGVSDYRHHQSLESVQANLRALERILLSPEHLGLPAAHCRVLRNPGSADEVMEALEAAADRATDTLIFYYAGHGFADEDGLYLGLPGTRHKPGSQRYHAVHYEWVRRAVLQGEAQAARRIIILDCCYSGRAASEATASVMGSANTDVHGTVVWAATSPSRPLAKAPVDAEYTAFTGELVRVLDTGVDGAAEVLDMDTIFHRVSRSLVAKGFPQPDRHNHALGGQVALVRNRVGGRPGPETQPGSGAGGGAPAGGPDVAGSSVAGSSGAGASASWEPFTWGPMRTDLVIVEGDGESAIPESSLHVRAVDEDVDLPGELAEWRDEIAAEQDGLKAAGKPYFWNGLNYAVERITIGRVDETESPEIYIQFQNSDYYTFLATQQLDRQFRDGTTPKSRYIDPHADPLDIEPFMSSSFGTNVAVITRDEKVIVSRRSQMVGSHPGTWNSSANEALSRVVDNAARQAPNIFGVARRGISEELALSADEYRLNMLALTIDKSTHQWGALFMARLRRVTAREFIERRSRGVSDKWEHDRHELVDFEIEPVIRFIFDPERRGLWSPTAPGLFYLALVNKYGRVAVERESRRLLGQDPGAALG
ncbi:caspase domain-containing protein [Streptomyces sp. NPDC048603]|uniref:caspase family protein n=1 Tax=Streptomyces sp. NPDC048603 TaxID=3365577 RepID=UPI00371A3660